jgi:hypothetical protein
MARAKQSKVAPKLPAGFKAIERLGDFWVGRKPGDVITGKLLSVKKKHFDANKKLGYAARDVNVYTIDFKGKKTEVTQSGGLGALEQVKKGQMVYIEYIGLKKIKGKSPMREYIVAVK